MGTLSSPNLQSLLTEVRIQLNTPDPNNSLWRDDELSGYLNDAVRRYFVECVQANEGYFTVQTGGSIPDLNISANVETIALPSDCFDLKNVWKKVTNGFISLSYRNTMTEGYSTQGGTSSEAYLPYYTFQGNNLVLRPTPNYNETGGIRIEYTQFPTTMIYGGDSITSGVSPIFKELIVMYATYKAKLRESMVNGGTMYLIPAAQVADLYKSFNQAIVKRSKNPTYVEAWLPESS